MYDTLTHQPDPMSSIKGASILETSEPETIPDTKAPSSTPFFGPRRLVGFAKKPKKDKNKKNRWSKVQYDPSYHLRAKKTGMPDYMLDNLEALSGYDMSDVRVHRNSPLPAQIGAYSYAQGTNIYLGPNRECDLGHEAWHIAQQKRGLPSEAILIEDKPIKIPEARSVNALEAEADEAAARLKKQNQNRTAGRVRGGKGHHITPPEVYQFRNTFVGEQHSRPAVQVDGTGGSCCTPRAWTHRASASKIIAAVIDEVGFPAGAAANPAQMRTFVMDCFQGGISDRAESVMERAESIQAGTDSRWGAENEVIGHGQNTQYRWNDYWRESPQDRTNRQGIENANVRDWTDGPRDVGYLFNNHRYNLAALLTPGERMSVQGVLGRAATRYGTDPTRTITGNPHTPTIRAAWNQRNAAGNVAVQGGGSDAAHHTLLEAALNTFFTNFYNTCRTDIRGALAQAVGRPNGVGADEGLSDAAIQQVAHTSYNGPHILSTIHALASLARSLCQVYGANRVNPTAGLWNYGFILGDKHITDLEQTSAHQAMNPGLVAMLNDATLWRRNLYSNDFAGWFNAINARRADLTIAVPANPA